MSDFAIKVEGLGKKYLLQHQAVGRRYETLRDVLAHKAKALFQNRKPETGNRKSVEEFWALKDVAFEIKQGEAVGIIGRNGAGKSTLLKLLSRITEPTTGRIRVRGRVASLLEVGTGFHPELTGRENIFLNGAILGMQRAEIRKKFDEIVAFAEVEKFLDTPVKRYSSGMYMRLAFAVAAHLEPEILVVDEVLAVGDAQFQKKCLGKMREVKGSGRTVLFVSHNLAAIQSLCTRGILLTKGRLSVDAEVQSCISEYEHGGHLNTISDWRRTAVAHSIALEFESIALKLIGQQPAMKLNLDCNFNQQNDYRPAIVAFDITDSLGVPIMQALPSLEPFINRENSHKRFCFEIDLPPLVPGQYWLSAWIGPHNTETFDFVKEVVGFEILESPTPGRTVPHTPDHGFLVPPSTFKIKSV
jgi:lipopolysaccharide transport system ATP-binding protein